MLDRGTTKDWFSSPEIVIEAMVAGIALYLFVVHMLTAKKPFIPRDIFKDRNFVSGLVLMFVMGLVLAGLLGAAVALSAEPVGAQRHPDRLSDGAARLRRDVRHDVRRPADHEDGSAPAS